MDATGEKRMNISEVAAKKPKLTELLGIIVFDDSDKSRAVEVNSVNFNDADKELYVSYTKYSVLNGEYTPVLRRTALCKLGCGWAGDPREVALTEDPRGNVYLTLLALMDYVEKKSIVDKKKKAESARFLTAARSDCSMIAK